MELTILLIDFLNISGLIDIRVISCSELDS